MAITSYTTAASIRAVLGISEPEIPDATIALAIYEVMLKEDLREMNVSLRADFLALTPPLSDDETRFSELMQTYCAYQVASQLMGALPLFAPKKIEDASTKLERYEDPFENLRTSILASLSYLRGVLLAAYEVVEPGEVAPAATVRVLVVNVGLGVDPITGV